MASGIFFILKSGTQSRRPAFGRAKQPSSPLSSRMTKRSPGPEPEARGRGCRLLPPFRLTPRRQSRIILDEKRNTETSGRPQLNFRLHISTQPSLCRVAVVAFYNDRDGEPPDMQCNSHRPHPLSEIDGQPPAAIRYSSPSTRSSGDSSTLTMNPQGSQYLRSVQNKSRQKNLMPAIINTYRGHRRPPVLKGCERKRSRLFSIRCVTPLSESVPLLYL